MVPPVNVLLDVLAFLFACGGNVPGDAFFYPKTTAGLRVPVA
jgi:hypothetical protein